MKRSTISALFIIALTLVLLGSQDTEARCRRGWRHRQHHTCYVQSCCQPRTRNDCDDDKEELEEEFEEVRFGSCNHLTSAEADVRAAELAAEMVIDGYVVEEAGHTTVDHDPPRPNTFLSYAAGHEAKKDKNDK